MKKVYKIIYILIVLIAIFFIQCRVDAKEMDIWGTGKKWINEGLEQNDNQLVKMETTTKNSFQEIIDFLWGIGLLVILITTVVLGIKMMTVPPGEKSRVKKALSPYIVGVIIIFGSVTIWKLLIEILDGNL